MYPAEIAPGRCRGLSERLDGLLALDTFRRTTVVRAFSYLEPDVAFFVTKDAAQSAVIRRMVPI